MITSADLPLNARGAVYHLDLLPEELAPTVITVGDPARVEQISQRFDSIEVKRMHREFVTHTGLIGNKRVSVVSTGIGVPNIDVVINELDALVNIDLDTRVVKEEKTSLSIIRLGTAGGLQPNCQPDDIFTTQYAIGFDSLLDYYETIPTETQSALHSALTYHLEGESGSFYVSEPNDALLSHFSDIGRAGITATCGGFYGPQGRMLRIPLRFPELLNKLTSFRFLGLPVINFEMETAAILGLGQLLAHRCLSLSVIVANRSMGTFTKDVYAAVEHLIESALEHVGCLV